MPPSWVSTFAAMFAAPCDIDELRLRSPFTYVRQIVGAGRANTAEVGYLVFDDEGKGFTGRINDVTAHQVIVELLVKNLAA